MSGQRPRLLLTGFGPFPGAPFNPTPALVTRLLQLRRPAFADIDRIGHVFEVSYAAVDRDLPALLSAHAPDAVLMFGLAQRTPYIRIERRARNTVTALWPDAARRRGAQACLAPGAADSLPFGGHTHQLLRAARQSGARTEQSRDAGRYLCNYLSWRAIEATQASSGPALAAFIHVPLVERAPAQHRPSSARRVDFEQLVDAGEAIMLAMIRLTRQRLLASD